MATPELPQVTVQDESQMRELSPVTEEPGSSGDLVCFLFSGFYFVFSRNRWLNPERSVFWPSTKKVRRTF